MTRDSAELLRRLAVMRQGEGPSTWRPLPETAHCYCEHGRYVGFRRVFVESCSDCMTWEVDVDYSTNDALKGGRSRLGTSRVAVWAEADFEALLLASQIVASSIKWIDGKKALVMPTGARLVI